MGMVPYVDVTGAVVARIVRGHVARPQATEAGLFEGTPRSTIVLGHAGDNGGDVRITLPGGLDEEIDDLGTEALTGELLPGDEVIDAGGVVRDPGRGQRPLPSGIVIEEIALDETHGIAVALDDEEFGGVRSVEGRPVSLLDRHRIRILAPPHLHVRCGQPLRQKSEVRSTEDPKTQLWSGHADVDGPGCGGSIVVAAVVAGAPNDGRYQPTVNVSDSVSWSGVQLAPTVTAAV
jgi:hypothetical protein